MKNDLLSYDIVEEVVLHVCATILLNHKKNYFGIGDRSFFI